MIFVDLPRVLISRTNILPGTYIISLSPPPSSIRSAVSSLYTPVPFTMPKASQSPSKRKKCAICRVSFRVQNFSAHTKKCERERTERQGERRYEKTRQRRLRALEAAYFGARLTDYIILTY